MQIVSYLSINYAITLSIFPLKYINDNYNIIIYDIGHSVAFKNQIPNSLAAALLGFSSLFGASYNVDVAHTNIAFKVKHMMISTVTGQFETFSGTFDLDEKSGILTNLKGEVEVDSINTNIEDRDAHLKSSEILDVQKYPKITFVLEKIKGDKAHGKLTIKDVTKDVVLDYEFGGTVIDPSGKKRAGFTLTGTIDRREYNVTWNRDF